MSERSGTVSDPQTGRTIAYAEWGDPTGTTVMFFHGNPGDRSFPHLELWGRELGIRFVCPERPGFGESPFQKRRRILDWPADVTRIADHLGVHRFGVAGVSAGGPYALACAHSLPERVAHASSISGVMPPGAPRGTEGMRREARMSVAIARRAWPLLVLMTRPLGAAVRKNPDRFFDRSLRSMPEPDRMVASRDDVRAWFVDRARQTGGPGSKGSAYELSIQTKSWGFAFEDIAAPVSIWHGAEDSLVPLHAAEWGASKIPSAVLHVVEGAGHLLLFDRWRDIFEPMATPPEGTKSEVSNG